MRYGSNLDVVELKVWQSSVAIHVDGGKKRRGRGNLGCGESGPDVHFAGNHGIQDQSLGAKLRHQPATSCSYKGDLVVERKSILESWHAGKVLEDLYKLSGLRRSQSTVRAN